MRNMPNPYYEKRAFDDATEQRILNDYASGQTLYQLSLKWNCCEVTVKRAVERQGGKMRPVHQCRLNLSMLLHDWQVGTPSKVLAKKYGFSSAKNLTRYVARWRRSGWNFGNRTKDGGKSVIGCTKTAPESVM